MSINILNINFFVMIINKSDIYNILMNTIGLIGGYYMASPKAMPVNK